MSVNLQEDQIKYRTFKSYGQFLRKDNKRNEEVMADNEGIKVDNTIFSEVLNDLLKEKGYIDTTTNLFKNSYLNDVLINANIKSATFHLVNSGKYKYDKQASRQSNITTLSPTGSLVYVRLGITWEAVDHYNNPLFASQIDSKSGQFAIHQFKKSDRAMRSAIKDTIEMDLIKFLRKKEVEKILTDKQNILVEENFEPYPISRSNDYVSNMNQAVQSSVTLVSEQGHGSGFFISEDGYIITNYHVISSGISNFKVRLNDGSEYIPELIRSSKIHDMALLKVDLDGIIPFKVNESKQIDIATDIYAVGTPSFEDLAQSVSKGIISGVRTLSEDSKLIQTDVGISPGNSGGAMIDKSGLLLGVISSKLVGQGVDGVAFGVPAYEVLEALKIEFQ